MGNEFWEPTNNIRTGMGGLSSLLSGAGLLSKELAFLGPIGWGLGAVTSLLGTISANRARHQAEEEERRRRMLALTQALGDQWNQSSYRGGVSW